MTLDELQSQITAFNFDASPSQLAEAWKIAKSTQDLYRQNSTEYKLLLTFQTKLLKQIHTLRKKPNKEPELSPVDWD